MSGTTWVGQDGDWNDPSNWSGGSVPSSDDIPTFVAARPATVEGSAYVGTIELRGASLTVSGDLASDGVTPGLLRDEAGLGGTLTIDPWGSASLNGLALQSTFLEDQGSLLTDQASIDDGSIDGSSAVWVSSQGTVAGTLIVENGGAAFGDFSLETGASLDVDATSTIGDGTISANGNSFINFLNSSEPGGGTQLVTDSLYVSSGSTLTLQSATGGTICLASDDVGPGDLNVSDLSLIFGDVATPSAQSSASEVSGEPTASVYNITQSTIDFRNNTVVGGSQTDVKALGSTDTVYGGGSPLWVNVATSSLASIFLAAGDTTVDGSSGKLSVQGGSGDLVVYDTHSADTLVGGSGNNTLVGGAGSSIHVLGSGSNIIGTNSNNALLDASAASGTTTLFSGSASGTTTMIGGMGTDVFVGGGGSLQVTCGSGNDSVWAAPTLSSTIVGGAGNDVIQGGFSSLITVTGGGNDVVVTGAGSSNIDALGQDGKLLVFSVGSADVNVVSGTRALLAVVGQSSVTVNGSEPGSVLWCLDQANVSLDGSSNSTLVLAGAHDTINATSGIGTNVLALSGCSDGLIRLDSGADEVICGSYGCQVDFDGGHDTVFAGAGRLSLDFQSGSPSAESAVVLGFNSSDDKVTFEEPPTSAIQTPYGLDVSYDGGTVLFYNYSGPL